VIKRPFKDFNKTVRYDMTDVQCYVDWPSSMAFLTALRPSWRASLICTRVCLLGPLISIVTEWGFLHSSTYVYLSSPCHA